MGMHAGRMAGGSGRGSQIAGACVLFCLAAAALAFFAAGETGSPVLGVDGIWRTSGDWTVNGGDDLEYANATIEVAGNLTLEPGAALRLENATLTFANATGRNASVKATGANLTFEKVSVVSDADLAVSVASALFNATDSKLARTSGAPAALRIAGNGTYNLATTDFGTLYTAGGPTVVLRALVRIELVNATGSPVQGRVNGSAGSDFFFEISDAQGRIAPRRILWAVLSPAPAEQTREARVGGPLIATGFAAGVGGNTSTVPISLPIMNVTLRLDHPFDLGVASAFVVDHDPEANSHGAYFVAPNETVRVVIRVRNSEGQTSPPASLNATWYKTDPSSGAFLDFKPLPSLEIPALAPGETYETSLYQVPGDWGTWVHRSGRCFESDQYYSAFELRLPGEASGDFGPWNDSARVALVAYSVVGDPTDNCTQGADSGTLLIGASAAAAFAGVAAITYYFSGERPARRAARRADREKQQPPK